MPRVGGLGALAGRFMGGKQEENDAKASEIRCGRVEILQLYKRGKFGAFQGAFNFQLIHQPFSNKIRCTAAWAPIQ